MASIDQMKRERDDLLTQQDTLSRKISDLRRALAIEASANVQFQLKEQIKAATQEREQVEAQIDELSEKIAADERQLGGGLTQAATAALAGRPRPQSKAYGDARQYIDEILLQPPQRRRASKLGEIERSLLRANHAEGGEQAHTHVRCYLRFEQARVHYLRGKYDEARAIFEEVRDHLIDTDDDDPLLREAREFLAVIELQSDIANLIERGRLMVEVRIQHIVTFISSSMSRADLARSPAACMLYHELSQIAQAQEKEKENPVAAEILGPQRMASLQSAAREQHADQPHAEQRHIVQDEPPPAPDQTSAPLIDGSNER